MTVCRVIGSDSLSLATRSDHRTDSHRSYSRSPCLGIRSLKDEVSISSLQFPLVMASSCLALR